MIRPELQTTGIHFTGQAVEWAVLRRKRKGDVEKVKEGSVEVPPAFFDTDPRPLFPAEVLASLRRTFTGIITVSLPSSDLLMTMLELPSTDPAELRSMVELQVDAASPFPLDQLTVSYEVFHQTEGHSRVLAVAARRKTVDALGDLLKAQHIYVRSLDAEVLAWWSLLIAHGEVRCENRGVLLLEEHTECALIITDDGVPVCIRSLKLFHDFSNQSNWTELAEEIRYTLLSLEPTYGVREISSVMVWSDSSVPDGLCTVLGDACGMAPTVHDLNTIPPLSEGLALRSTERRLHHVELVPKEWIDLQRRRKIVKVASTAAVAVLALWVGAVAVASTVFSIRQAGLNRIRRDADILAGPARAAQAAREEMYSLETYAERTHSALEVLREITINLPDGVDLGSFTFNKGEAVTLRGSANRADPIYEFFRRLGQSELFVEVGDQPVSTRTVQDRRISTFSVTASLPSRQREEIQ